MNNSEYSNEQSQTDGLRYKCGEKKGSHLHISERFSILDVALWIEAFFPLLILAMIIMPCDLAKM
jgi:hypothetical protein